LPAAAKLYINDYNIEGAGAKSDGMYNLAKTLVAQGVPLSGIPTPRAGRHVE
jgi:endo-1,4-beta-xylanase